VSVLEAARAATDERRRLLELLLAEEGIELANEDAIPRRPPGPEAPLSFAQQRLWLIDQLEPDSPLYNVAAAFRLSGDLAAPALEAAFREVQRRHEALRTTFGARDGQPVQVVSSRADLALPCVDLRGMPEAEAGRLVRDEARRPFDLRRGPLLRVTLLRWRQREWLLLLTLHHIVSDGWSIGILVKELGDAYRSFLAGQPPGLPELPIQYADFAIWQRQWLTGERVERELDYWRRQLAGAPPQLALPADRPHPALASSRGGRCTRPLGLPLTGSLGRLAERQGVTLFMVLLAVWSALLHRQCGADDLVVGTPVANRGRSEVQALIGLFVNTLVLRLRLGDDPRFSALLARSREVVLEAFSHQDLPFERLVGDLRPQRDRSRTPLFQVAFVLQASAETQELPGLRISAVPAEGGTSKFDLTLSMTEGPRGLVAALEYRRDLFEPDTIERMLERLILLAEGVVAAADSHLSELPWLTAAERGQLDLWNRTGAEYPRDRTVHELFSEVAERWPEAVALEWREERVTYGELERQANRRARRLRRLGVRPETAVGICLERSTGLIAWILGILKAGGFYVPLDPSYPRERLALIAEDAGLRFLVTGKGRAGIFPAGITIVPHDEDAIEREDASGLPAEAAAGNLAYVMYTSGSTGRPKGVAIPHRAIIRLVRGSRFADFGATECILQLAPPSFDAATFEIWGALLHGGRLAMFPGELSSFAELETCLARHRVSTLWLTAALFHQLVEERPQALKPVRRLLTGGDVVSPAHVRRALAEIPGCVVVNGYGPTENTTFTCCHEARDRSEVAEPLPIGRPVANTRVHVLDPHGGPQPVGMPGELCAGGDGLARGYHGRADLTAERFVPDPFGSPGDRLYRTGDLARWLPTGEIQFLGRIDLQVKIRGFRVEPGEVEAVLRTHPGLSAAAVVVREDRPGEKRLVGYAVPRPPENPSPAELLSFLGEKLPEYMVPSSLVRMDALPCNANGKVDRGALPAPPAVEGREDELIEPRGPVEEMLAGIWADLFGRDRIGPEDDFFELGGHSLLGIRVLARTRELLGVELKLADLFEGSTLSVFAGRVEAARREASGLDAVPITPLPAGRQRPLSFGQQRLWLLQQLDPASSAYNLPNAVWILGRLDRHALRRALQEIFRRHEVLRGRFTLDAGAPVLTIDPLCAFPLPLVDLGGLPEAEREARAVALALVDLDLPFDLGQGPLCRPVLYRLGDERHALALTMHHIVFDGGSIGVFLRELAAIYEAFSSGGPSPLPPPRLQFADFAAWQRDRISGELLARQLDFWRGQLAGAPAFLPLGPGRADPARGGGRRAAARVLRTLSAELSEGLKGLGRSQGATPFMTLLAGFDLLLHCQSGATDILVGMTSDERNRRDVIRADLSGDPTFLDLLARVRATALAVYDHRDMPFDKLVAELRPDRRLGPMPLVNVAFNFLPEPIVLASPAGFQMLPVPLPARRAPFDLSLTVTSSAGGFVCSLISDEEIFDAREAASLLSDYESLLQIALAQPDLPVSHFREAWERLADQRLASEQERLRELRRRKLGARRPPSPPSTTV
jgi:amino acid adenylation domain-containing protein